MISTTLLMRQVLTRVLAVALSFALVPSEAIAHVKWFCSSADVSQSPITLDHVLTPVFVALCGGFLLLVYGGFWLDGVIARRWPPLAASGELNAAIEEKLVRLAVGGYFLLLWDKGAVVLWERGDAILTPELTAATAWMNILQFAIAASCAWRRTCALAAVGICLLYGYGVEQFGVFHMIDYVFFLGIAAYLTFSSIDIPGVLKMRVPLLAGGLAFGLMWTAIEKFVYPAWTLEVVAAHPNIAFGFSGPFAVVVAGFVEFTLAFYIMMGRGLVRFGSGAYAAIFLIAIPEFGHLDAVGHLPIIAILVVVCFRGNTPLQRLSGVLEWRPGANAAAITGIYFMSFVAFFDMYYWLHRIEYR